MSSRDHLWSQQWNYQQLQMLMPAKHLIELPFHEPDREMTEMQSEEYIDADGESHWEGGGEMLEDDDQFWDRKLSESAHKYPSDRVLWKIEEDKRVNVPVDVGFDDFSDGFPESGSYLRIRDGHHRIASANEINPDMEVPINYVDLDWINNRWEGT
jgi:hypothetical protein